MTHEEEYNKGYAEGWNDALAAVKVLVEVRGGVAELTTNLPHGSMAIVVDYDMSDSLCPLCGEFSEDGDVHPVCETIIREIRGSEKLKEVLS
jgi:hypothetical protein